MFKDKSLLIAGGTDSCGEMANTKLRRSLFVKDMKAEEVITQSLFCMLGLAMDYKDYEALLGKTMVFDVLCGHQPQL